MMSVYKPAVLPSTKKTVKLGTVYYPLSNRPDPDIIDQLGGELGENVVNK